MKDLEKILVATLTGMSVEDFKAEASKWTEAARDPRWKRPYTDLTYQPMQDVLRYLRDNDYKTYIVTGGGQDFVRVYAERVYGIPPEQVVGTAGSTKYGYAKNGKPFLTKEPKLLLNDNDAGKPEGINLMIGRRPYAAFGNSTGDQQMLEYTGGRRRQAPHHAGAARRCRSLGRRADRYSEFANCRAFQCHQSKSGCSNLCRQRGLRRLPPRRSGPLALLPAQARDGARDQPVSAGRLQQHQLRSLWRARFSRWERHGLLHIEHPERLEETSRMMSHQGRLAKHVRSSQPQSTRSATAAKRATAGPNQSRKNLRSLCDAPNDCLLLLA
jgi:phosphoserine phosphatase